MGIKDPLPQPLFSPEAPNQTPLRAMEYLGVAMHSLAQA